MTLLDLNRLAEALTAPQFEQLLRLRLQRAFSNTAAGPGIIMLVASPEYNKPKELKNAEWVIGHHGDQTKSEILDDAIVEHNRRLAFVASSKLNLIEASPEVELAPLDDNIPF